MTAPVGQRGYRLALWSLLCGTCLLALGIHSHADLTSLGIAITGMVGSALGATAFRASAEYRAQTPPSGA